MPIPLKQLALNLVGLGPAASANAVPVVLASDDAQVGTDIAGAAMPAGGAGLRGWLSAIAQKIAAGVTVFPAIGSPTEASAVTIAITGGVLSTAAASTRLGFWFCQNQSTANLLVVLDDGANNAVSVFALAGATAAGQEGASMGSSDTGPHAGRIRVYGAAGSQHALRVQ